LWRKRRRRREGGREARQGRTSIGSWAEVEGGREGGREKGRVRREVMTGSDDWREGGKTDL